MSKKNITRRDFLKGTAAGALGLTMAGLFGGCTAEAPETSAAEPVTQAPDTTAGETTQETTADQTVQETTTQAAEAETKEASTGELGEATITYEAEVAIVGAGAAGLMAALNLARAGKKILILEAGPSTATSNFSMCGGPAACETKLQKEEDAWVSLDTLFGHMYAFSNTSVNGKLLKKVLAGTGKAIDDMMDLGVKMSLWPDVYGNGFRARHYIESAGEARTAPIAAEIEANGGQFVYGVKVKEPVMENGKVVGVKGVCGDDIVEVRANASLICTGGFLGNKEMQKKYFNTEVFPLGSTVSDGSGIELVHKAGGVDDRGFAVLGNECGAVTKGTQGWPFTQEWFNKNEHYGYWLFGGLYTDANGERFIDEGQVARFPLAIGGEALVRQGKAYCIMDSEYYDKVREEGIFAFLGKPEEWAAGEEADYYKTTPENAEDHLTQAIEEGWAVKADTLGEIAEAFGLTRLEETVEQYNGYCDAGRDEEFYKSAFFLKPVRKAPFYAFEYMPSAWGTNGGIKVNASLRALNGDNQPIEGLFVAGVDAGSMYTMPYYDNPGSSVGLAIGSGVLAAAEIEKYLG